MIIKYLLNGQKVELIRQLDEGFLVSNINDISDNDETFEYTSTFIYYVNKVFDSAPKEKYSDEITLLQKQVNKLIQEINSIKENKNTLLNEIKEIENKNKELFSKLTKYKQLKNLENFIDGKITHYVELSYSGNIVELKNKTEQNKRDLKLLVLFGESNGDLQWKVNLYTDGSESNYMSVIPCLSYEEALKTLESYLIDKCNEILNKKQSMNEYLINTADKFNIKLPVEYLNKWKEESIKNLNNTKEGYLKAIEGIDRSLEKIK